MIKKNPLSLQLKAEDFLPATDAEKQSVTQMRPSVSFWKDAMNRLGKNKVAMISLVVIVLIIGFSFVAPAIYPYKYEQQVQGSENLQPLAYSQSEKDKMAAGEKVFPHLLGTDNLGRDYAIRMMMGCRISLLVGLIAAFLILIIGAVYGAVAGYFGGWADLIMMRLVDIIYTVPDILIIILISFAIKEPMKSLAAQPGFHWIQSVGVNLISIFLIFALLYWVGMARIVRSQVLTIKQHDFITAAKALGASNGRIIRRHLLTNCVGILIVTTTLQIPLAIFTESFLSFLGLGVAIPMPSLGSLASDALNGINTYPIRLIAPALLISLIILSFNLFGDGLRDAFDPKLKH